MSDAKRSLLILCHTFFHNAFRSGKHRKPRGALSQVKKWAQSRFIADFIIEMGSERSEGYPILLLHQKKYLMSFLSNLKASIRVQKLMSTWIY